MKEIFDRHAFKFVIFFGTLLGARRSGTVIYNDSDFDIMCFAKDYLKWDKVKEDLIKIGFNIPVNKPLMDEYLIRNGEKIDINWMISFGSYYVYDDGIYYPKDYFDTVTTTKLFDMSWPCPSNPDRVLTELYGSDWKIPQAKKGKLAIYPKQ
jgi:phosphorylcholine metabolism protein LicD